MYGVIEDKWRMVLELRTLVPTVIMDLSKKKLLDQRLIGAVTFGPVAPNSI